MYSVICGFLLGFNSAGLACARLNPNQMIISLTIGPDKSILLHLEHRLGPGFLAQTKSSDKKMTGHLLNVKDRIGPITAQIHMKRPVVFITSERAIWACMNSPAQIIP